MTVHSPFASLLDELEITTDVVTVLGSETHYWVYGPEDAEVTIVVAHGYRGEHHGLEPVIAQFRGVRIIGPDMPGFGDSTPLTEVGHDIPGYAAWLGQFIEALGLTGRSIILGHSFGSIISTWGVANGLLSTEKLVLVNPIAASALEGPNAFLTRLTMAFYAFSMKLPRRTGEWMLRHWVIVQFMSSALTRTRDRELRRWIHDQHHTYFGNFADRETVVDAFNASVSMDISTVGANIDVPTLLIGAEHDSITSVAQLEELQAMMPNATLHVIPDVGHLIHYEKAHVAARYIVDFLGQGSVVDEPPIKA
ncbi:alpha/beta hydrolase [Glaciihabitans arcticus]|uniref:Alpha/beta hydrolase n=1 Tax=Glaciihabitans arcticus TaxID=2668039 RepID=A0A4V2JES1_9MICO|nr:alpha/beta hydrolase [Glaciihabitans arcticus]TBN56669.1 alpha/beta hydrolase [Glaciihabitans arcticus]